MLIMAFRGVMANQCSQIYSPSAAVGDVEATACDSFDPHQISGMVMAGMGPSVHHFEYILLRGGCSHFCLSAFGISGR